MVAHRDASTLTSRIGISFAKPYITLQNKQSALKMRSPSTWQRKNAAQKNAVEYIWCQPVKCVESMVLARYCSLEDSAVLLEVVDVGADASPSTISAVANLLPT